MSVLDTFYLLFESDASKLNKGLDESDRRARKTTDEVKKLDEAAYKMGERLGETMRSLGGALVGFLAARSLMASFNTAVVEADALDESAKALGITTEELSAYSDAVKEAGGSSQGFQGSLRALNQALATMETTGKSRAAPFLKQMGIDLDSLSNKGKTAFDFLPQIADAFADMGRQESLAMGQKIGFDIGTIMMLQGGRRELEALIQKHKELGVVTERQGEIAAKYNDSLDDARHALRSMWLGLAETILPVVTRIVEGFTQIVQFVRENHHFVIGLFVALAAVIGKLLLPVIVTTAGAVLALVSPFLGVAAVVGVLAGAFALLYDDVMNFLEGNDSLIGQLLTKFPMLAQVFHIIGAVAREVAGVIEAAFKLAGAGILAMWDHIAARVRALWGYVKSFWDAASSIASKLGGALSNHQFAAPDVAPGVAAGQAMLGLAASTPLNSQTTNSVTTRRGGDRNTSVNVERVEVNTQATDGPGIAKSIGGAIGAQMSQAVASYDDGVAA